MRDANTELQNLYNAEYGQVAEVMMRVIGVVFGGALLYWFTGWIAAYVWGIVFAIAHATQWIFLRAHLGKAKQRDAHIGGALLVIVHVAFIWLPTYLAMQPELALLLVGLLVFTTTALYHIMRADTALWLVWAQITVFAVALLLILMAQLPRIEQPAAKIGSALATFMTITYLAMTMLATRKAKIELIASVEQLAQDQKMSAIGKLAGGVAHDFNNTLMVVQGNLDIYKHLKTEVEKASALADALAAAKRAQGVVEHLLIYARKGPAQKAVVDVRAIVHEVKRLAEPIIPNRILVNFYPCSARLDASLDSTQLMTAVLNLANNAVDAMTEHGQLTMRTAHASFRDKGPALVNAQTLSAGDYAVVTVQDTGTGIAPDLLSKSVEPFFTTKDTGKGTGLGLSMVLGFVTELGGGMAMESSPNGTTVRLYLPLAPQTGG